VSFGVKRGLLGQFADGNQLHPAFDKEESENQALTLSLRNTSHELANLLSQMQLPASVVNQLRSMIDDTLPPKLADMVASMIDLTIEEKLSVLDTVEPKERIEKVLKLLARQIQVIIYARNRQLNRRSDFSFSLTSKSGPQNFAQAAVDGRGQARRKATRVHPA